MGSRETLALVLVVVACTLVGDALQARTPVQPVAGVPSHA